MASETARRRPVSPHLQVWRWHVTMLVSILHRATGLALIGGALLMAAWLVAVAVGQDAYLAVEQLWIAGSPLAWFGRLILFAATLAAFLHLFNGLRHLVWDFGHGFAPRTASLTGWLVLALAFFAAAALWAAAYYLPW